MTAQKATPMADTCPDCGRPRVQASSAFYRALSGQQRLEFCSYLRSITCQSFTIARLRARVAELEQAHAEQVAELESSVALRALDMLENEFLLEHRTYSVSESLKRALASLRARYSLPAPLQQRGEPSD